MTAISDRDPGPATPAVTVTAAAAAAAAAALLVLSVWWGVVPAGAAAEVAVVAAAAAPAAAAVRVAAAGRRPPPAAWVAAAFAAVFAVSQWVVPVGHPFPPFTMYTEPAARGQVLTFTMVDDTGRAVGHVPFRDAGTVSGAALGERFVQLTAAALTDPAALPVLSDALAAVIGRRHPPGRIAAVDVAVCTSTTTAPAPVCEPLLTIPTPAPTSGSSGGADRSSPAVPAGDAAPAAHTGDGVSGVGW